MNNASKQMPPLTSIQIEQLARRTARAKMGWLIHASIYLLVNLGMLLASSMSSHPWAHFPAMGWGLGLLIHGLMVLKMPFMADWRERMVAREKVKLQKRYEGTSPAPHDPW